MHTMIKPLGSTSSRKRKGRGQGSGLGCTAGRGNNGQNSRSGGGVRPGFEGGQMPLYRRIARRGFSNYPFKKHIEYISLQDLQRKFADGETVSIKTLLSKQLISSNVRTVKILANGTISKTLVIDTNINLSNTAKDQLEKSGATIISEKTLTSKEEKNGK